jgi:hypothetical protein
LSLHLVSSPSLAERSRSFPYSFLLIFHPHSREEIGCRSFCHDLSLCSSFRPLFAMHNVFGCSTFSSFLVLQIMILCRLTLLHVFPIRMAISSLASCLLSSFFIFFPPPMSLSHIQSCHCLSHSLLM